MMKFSTFHGVRALHKGILTSLLLCSIAILTIADPVKPLKGPRTRRRKSLVPKHLQKTARKRLPRPKSISRHSSTDTSNKRAAGANPVRKEGKQPGTKPRGAKKIVRERKKAGTTSKRSKPASKTSSAKAVRKRKQSVSANSKCAKKTTRKCKQGTSKRKTLRNKTNSACFETFARQFYARELVQKIGDYEKVLAMLQSHNPEAVKAQRGTVGSIVRKALEQLSAAPVGYSKKRSSKRKHYSVKQEVSDAVALLRARFVDLLDDLAPQCRSDAIQNKKKGDKCMAIVDGKLQEVEFCNIKSKCGKYKVGVVRKKKVGNQRRLRCFFIDPKCFDIHLFTSAKEIFKLYETNVSVVEAVKMKYTGEFVRSASDEVDICNDEPEPLVPKDPLVLEPRAEPVQPKAPQHEAIVVLEPQTPPVVPFSNTPTVQQETPTSLNKVDHTFNDNITTRERSNSVGSDTSTSTATSGLSAMSIVSRRSERSQESVERELEDLRRSNRDLRCAIDTAKKDKENITKKRGQIQKDTMFYAVANLLIEYGCYLLEKDQFYFLPENKELQDTLDWCSKTFMKELEKGEPVFVYIDSNCELKHKFVYAGFWAHVGYSIINKGSKVSFKPWAAQSMSTYTYSAIEKYLKDLSWGKKIGSAILT